MNWMTRLQVGLAVILLPIGVYVGLYATMHRRISIGSEEAIESFAAYSLPWGVGRAPLQRFWMTFFRPIHAIDRRVRSELWATETVPLEWDEGPKVDDSRRD